MDIDSINYGDINWQEYGGLFIKPLGNREYGVVRVENLEDLTGETMNGYMWWIERSRFWADELEEYRETVAKELDREIETITDEDLVYYYIAYYGMQTDDGIGFKETERNEMEKCVQDSVDNY